MDSEDKKKNIVDKFLDSYEALNNNQKIKVRVYRKPSKVKCVFYFIFGIAILFALLFGFGFYFSFGYIAFLLADLAVIVFFGINLFTKKGIGLPTYVEKSPEDVDEHY